MRGIVCYFEFVGTWNCKFLSFTMILFSSGLGLGPTLNSNRRKVLEKYYFKYLYTIYTAKWVQNRYGPIISYEKVEKLNLLTAK